ncbi:Rv3235 family protein [Micromonospora sp. WMMA1923]|uniref:Rv3235 family protein n=1 Tax=Micromonospora sp. WMMA1923 TaxID=3404125 RepID=UPI003B965703
MVDTRRPTSARPPFRLRPVPPLDPPFTDDPADLWPRPPSLQLALDLFDPARAHPGRPNTRQRDPRPTPTRPEQRPPTTGPRLPGGGTSPEAGRAAHRFVTTCLEILNGYRPPGQIRPLAAPDAVAEVTEQLARGAARSGPVRRRSTRPTVRLRRLRVCEPRAGAVEVAAVLGTPTGRSWAMALRLEHRRGSWLCTTIQVL